MVTKNRKKKAPLPECTATITNSSECAGGGGNYYAVEWDLAVVDHRGGENYTIHVGFPLRCAEEVAEFLAELHAFGAEADDIADIEDAWGALHALEDKPVALHTAPGGDFRCAELSVRGKKWRPKARHLRAIEKGFGLGNWGEEADAA
jgi:hypothetical protein